MPSLGYSLPGNSLNHLFKDILHLFPIAGFPFLEFPYWILSFRKPRPKRFPPGSLIPEVPFLDPRSRRNHSWSSSSYSPPVFSFPLIPFQHSPSLLHPFQAFCLRSPVSRVLDEKFPFSKCSQEFPRVAAPGLSLSPGSWSLPPHTHYTLHRRLQDVVHYVQRKALRS